MGTSPGTRSGLISGEDAHAGVGVLEIPLEVTCRFAAGSDVS